MEIICPVNRLAASRSTTPSICAIQPSPCGRASSNFTSRPSTSQRCHSNSRSGGSVNDWTRSQPRTPCAAPNLPTSTRRWLFTATPKRSGCVRLAERGDQVLHAVGLLRALGHPVVDAREVELEAHFGLHRLGIEIAHLFEALATLALAAIG